MERLKTVLVGLAGAGVAVGVVVALGPVSTVSADLGSDQADSLAFALGFPDGESMLGDVVYCGVGRASEPFVFEAAVTNPPIDDVEIEGVVYEGHELAGWLGFELQGTPLFPGPFDGTRRAEMNIPSNSTENFNLTLGGRPGRDQMVRLISPPLGDPTEGGGGTDMYGYASVRAARGAQDPFTGDGRSDNFCVTIGVDGRPWSEFQEGAISTTLPVPDGWVVDGDGSNGGVLTGMPH